MFLINNRLFQNSVVRFRKILTQSFLRDKAKNNKHITVLKDQRNAKKETQKKMPYAFSLATHSTSPQPTPARTNIDPRGAKSRFPH